MAHDLLRLGFILITLGLLTGLVVQKTANPRMALASHLEGVFNGLLLVRVGSSPRHGKRQKDVSPTSTALSRS